MPEQRQTPRQGPLIKSRKAVLVVVVLEVLFIGYLITRAFSADDEWRPWYLAGAAGLSLMTGVIAWTRLRRDRPEGHA